MAAAIPMAMHTAINRLGTRSVKFLKRSRHSNALLAHATPIIQQNGAISGRTYLGSVPGIRRMMTKRGIDPNASPRTVSRETGSVILRNRMNGTSNSHGRKYANPCGKLSHQFVELSF